MKYGERAAYDKSGPVCFTIVSRIADEEGVDPLELDPLHSRVDTDALENLVAGDDTQDLRVDFQYHGYNVSVEGDGGVDVDRR